MLSEAMVDRNRPSPRLWATTTCFVCMPYSIVSMKFAISPSNCVLPIHCSTGELVEKGLMRRLPDGFDGNTCPYIFTWSNERPNKTWGMGSGCAPFYNTDKKGQANTKMDRFFDEDRFEIYATRTYRSAVPFVFNLFVCLFGILHFSSRCSGDIEKDEELTHTYISLEWRTCFSDLNKIVNGEDK